LDSTFSKSTCVGYYANFLPTTLDFSLEAFDFFVSLVQATAAKAAAVSSVAPILKEP
jgi:hypothetical protein